MTIQRNTLFSISNEALKKERKYSLFLMRLGVIPYFLGYIVYSYSLFLFLNSYTSLGQNFLLFTVGYIALMGVPFFFFVRGLWRMQLWIYDLLLIPLVLKTFSLLYIRFLYGDFPLHDLKLLYDLYLLPVSLLAYFGAWRVRSFLRTHPHETERNALGIDTRTLFAFCKESLLTTKKNTLFSIKSQELRRKCPISLFLLRIYVFLLCLFIGDNCYFFTNIGNKAFVPFFGLFTMYALWGMALLFLWSLFQLNIYLYSFFGIVSSLFLIYVYIAPDAPSTISFFWGLDIIHIGLLWLLFFVFVGTIAAWRVHICLRKLQKQDEYEQEASEQKEDQQDDSKQVERESEEADK